MEIPRHWRLRQQRYRPSIEKCDNCGEVQMAIRRLTCKNCGVVFRRKDEEPIKVEGTIFEIKVRVSGVK